MGADPVHKPDEMWPLAFACTCTTMAMEGLAMIPQMALSAAIRSLDTEQDSGADSPPITSRFIGMLSFGRCCRLLFWIGCAVHAELITGSVVQAFRSLLLFWPLILPDMCHTFLMMDYLVLLLGRGHLNAKRPRVRAAGEKILLQSMGSAM